MANDEGTVGSELGSLPIGELVRTMAMAIADAQVELDKSSVRVAQQMGASNVQIGRTTASMMELGFTPNFYRFVDTVIEVKLALRINRTARGVDPKTGQPLPGAGAVTVSSTPIDASYASSYNFDMQLASVFKTKLVSIPAPANLEERIRQIYSAQAEEDRGVAAPESVPSDPSP